MRYLHLLSDYDLKGKKERYTRYLSALVEILAMMETPTGKKSIKKDIDETIASLVEIQKAINTNHNERVLMEYEAGK